MSLFFKRFILCVAWIAILAIASACGTTPQPVNVVVFSAQHTAMPESTTSTAAGQNLELSQPTKPAEIKLPTTTIQTSDFAQATAMPSRESCLAKDSAQSTSTPAANTGMDAEQDWGYRCATIEMAQTPAKGQSITLQLIHQPENDPQKEIAPSVRELVENKDQPILALLGATSNENSVRLASLANFFTIPMVIPSSVADNLLPSNNLWGFRLSAPGASHAQYFFGSVLKSSVISSFNSDESELAEKPILKVAIWYEQNTFGESAAVAAAKEAMKQEIEIGFYGSFDPTTPDVPHLTAQTDEIRKIGVHLIYLVSSQPLTAQTVIKTIRANIPQEELPILMGQSGAFSSREFLDSPEAQDVYVLQQKVVADQCPLEITSLAAAQRYAAIALLRSAMQEAKDQAGNKYAAQTLSQKREALRDVLKTTNKDFACLGRVSFDNTGQNKNLQFEILHVTSMSFAEVIDEKAFSEILKQIYNRSPFDIN